MPNRAGVLQSRLFPSKLETDGNDAISTPLLSSAKFGRNRAQQRTPPHISFIQRFNAMTHCFIQKLLDSEAAEYRRLEERDKHERARYGELRSLSSRIYGRVAPSSTLGRLFLYESNKTRSTDIRAIPCKYSFDWPCQIIMSVAQENELFIAKDNLGELSSLIFPWAMANRIEQSFNLADVAIYEWERSLTLLQRWWSEGSTPNGNSVVYTNTYCRVADILIR